MVSLGDGIIRHPTQNAFGLVVGTVERRPSDPSPCVAAPEAAAVVRRAPDDRAVDPFGGGAALDEADEIVVRDPGGENPFVRRLGKGSRQDWRHGVR